MTPQQAPTLQDLLVDLQARIDADQDLTGVTLDDLRTTTAELQAAMLVVDAIRRRQHRQVAALRVEGGCAVASLMDATGLVHQRIYQILNDAGHKPRPKKKAPKGISWTAKD